MLGNATTHDRFGRREAEPPSRRTILALVVAIIAGAALCWYFRHPAQFPDRQRYTFGDRPPRPPRIDAALFADLGVIAGYVLVLGASAFIASRLAVSRLGASFGRFTRWALLVAATADLMKVLGLYLGTLLHSDPDTGFNGFVTVATAAMATIKTCSLVAALMAVPGALAVLSLRAYGRCQLRPSRQGPHWWNDCWAQPEVPTVRPDAVERDEWSWVNAYNVPGAAAVIERRKGEPVQAICLSGGGVRSACVAMGALQVFSDSAPATVAGRALEDDHAAGAQAPAPSDGQVGDDGVTTHAGSDEPRSDQPKLIDSVDYVISVSGGGYTAGARLLACQRSPDEHALSGNEPAGTPTSKRDPGRKLRLSERFEEGSVEFEHIRRHSSYIADSPPDLIHALFEVLKNLVGSVVTLFWMPVAIGFAGGYLLAAVPIAAFVPVPRYTSDGQRVSEDSIRNTPNYFPSLVHHPAALWAAGVFVAIAVIAGGCALFIEWRDYRWKSEHRRLRLLTRAQAASAFAGLTVALTVALPALMWACQHVNITHYAHFGGALGGLLGLQYLTAIVAMLWKYRNRIPVGQISSGSWRQKLPPGLVPVILVTLTLTAVLIALLGVLGSVAAGVFGYLTQHIGGHLQQVPWLPVWVIVLVGLILMVADVTSLSLHPFYRARLARTFAVRRFLTNSRADGAVGCEARPYPEDEPTWLHAYGKVEAGPQFVLAAAAAVSGDAKPAPGLNAVSYVLNEKYVGGPDLGWLKTEQLWHTCPPRLKRDLTVEAAVAISGAAFASTMGRQNNGFQTLLCLSGARLGTWLPNPHYVALLVNKTSQRDQAVSPAGPEPSPATEPKAPPQSLLRSLPTVRGFTYFYRELLGHHPIDASLVQVTDGGHYDDLGLVEALRRRCRLIFCIDGGGDPPPLLSGLADAIRLAQSELGVQIELEDSGDYGVQNLAPGSGRPFSDSNAFARLNSRITNGTVVRGRITYPAASGLPQEQRTGTLIFAKAVLWQRCPDWLLTYGAGNDVFPHDNTSDQWFNEGQFAAYTELGRLLGRNAVEAQKAPPLHAEVTEDASEVTPQRQRVPNDDSQGGRAD